MEILDVYGKDVMLGGTTMTKGEEKFSQLFPYCAWPPMGKDKEKFSPFPQSGPQLCKRRNYI